MKLNPAPVRACLNAFDFATLFREHIGWEPYKAALHVTVDRQTFDLNAVAEKRGVVVLVLESIPDRGARIKIDRQVMKSYREHLVIYCDRAAGRQVWNWVRREPGRPIASRDHRFDVGQPGDSLIQRLEHIAVSLEEEDSFTLVHATAGLRGAFDVDRVTKKFYEEFKAEHSAFVKLIKGLESDADLQWYTSLMLNRLMFVYFIQKKGFLDGDPDYLRNRLTMVRQARGKDQFQSFYRYFLLRLFHEGLGKAPEERKVDPLLEKLLGRVPYLDGGFFEVHQLEERNPDIDIPDKAFERLFAFFDRYRWHLDERPLRADNEVNPDVVGYIFEKYVNQKQMGAYYTKEDITEYISKSTVIPFLFDAAEKKCPIAFKAGAFIWRLVSDDPDRYIYEAVRHGVIDNQGCVIPLPRDIERGVHDVSKRDSWNRPASAPCALPTETWREHVARRTRCLDIRQKLKAGDVHAIDDLVTLNLDLWQFARDAIAFCEGPELLRAFWESLEKLTVLDPTCGSGAFLFAALRILETLYEDSLARMERFVEDASPRDQGPEAFADFRKVLAQIDKHPNERYFILKSIIINNLFGVDIMEEAVEICKLRLFLKLVAQVEDAKQIEPLPDIDFNVRAGNTLVGYAAEEDARKAFAGRSAAQAKLMLGDAEERFKRFEEDAETVQRAFAQFRLQQTIHGGRITPKDKRELRDRLAKLAGELDSYLAGDYGIKARDKRRFDEWRGSHQPFHWFVEFYGIMRDGGFDVIIGNPPYLERSKLKDQYRVLGFETSSCKDIYAWIVERCFQLRNDESRLGLIVPVSLASSGSFRVLRDIVARKSSILWLSHFANRPGQLFVGAQNRLTIVISAVGGTPLVAFSTRYHRWYEREGERAALMANIQYGDLGALTPNYLDCFPKVGDGLGIAVLRRMSTTQSLGQLVVRNSRWPVYWVRVPGYFCQFFLDPPKAQSENGGRSQPRGELNQLTFSNEHTQRVLHTVLNSSTYYQFFVTHTDGRHINPSDVSEFPWNPATCAANISTRLVALSKMLEAGMERHTSHTRKSGLVIESVDSGPLKPILDEIDWVLAEQYGFTGEERDFIVNYDIKYRVGADAQEDGE